MALSGEGLELKKQLTYIRKDILPLIHEYSISTDNSLYDFISESETIKFALSDITYLFVEEDNEDRLDDELIEAFVEENKALKDKLNKQAKEVEKLLVESGRYVKKLGEIGISLRKVAMETNSLKRDYIRAMKSLEGRG